MKIIIDKDIPFIKGRIKGDNDLIYLPGEEIDTSAMKDADAIIIRTRTKCNRHTLEGTSVRFIATATIGTDHIDLDWCRKNRIDVYSAPGCNAPGVAQYVLSALLRNGFKPQKHVLGIVGWGHIGSLIGEWARKIGARILVNDPPRLNAGFKDVEYVSLPELLKESDAVTLHVPFTKDGLWPTSGFIGAPQLSLMKDDAIIINTSRGGVVIEHDLKESLHKSHRKAIIDVWEGEPLLDKELLDLAVIATPHIAGYSYEGKLRGTAMALEALQSIGVNVDLTGLDCDASPLHHDINENLILNSYDPDIDSIRLKEAPENFELLRNQYDYRHEPLFSTK